jgi:hypothetical protein
MGRFSQIGLLLILGVFLWGGSAQGASSSPQKKLTVLSPKQKEGKNTVPLHLAMQEGAHSLQVTVRFSAPPLKESGKDAPVVPTIEEPGGDYQLFLDDLQVTAAVYKGTTVEAIHDIPVLTLQNGEHVLRCELRAPHGELHKAEVKFSFSGSPVITMTEPTVDKNGLLDAEVAIDLFGICNDLAGSVEMLIDQQSLGIVQVKTAQAGKKLPLSQLMGNPLTTGQQVSGVHLLTLRASALNGNSTVLHRSFKVTAIPSLEILRDKNGALREARAGFAKSPAGYSGAVEVFRGRDLLLTRREEGQVIVVTRAELDEALKKSPQLVDEGVTSLVFALRGANGMENWQVVEAHP